MSDGVLFIGGPLDGQVLDVDHDGAVVWEALPDAPQPTVLYHIAKAVILGALIRVGYAGSPPPPQQLGAAFARHTLSSSCVISLLCGAQHPSRTDVLCTLPSHDRWMPHQGAGRCWGGAGG
jgi:hypothetical protein